MKPVAITAEEFDRKFDAGEDVSAHIDWSKAKRPGRDTFKVNVDFPRDLLRRIDDEAARIGIARQAWIKMRLTDLLDAIAAANQAQRATIDAAIAKTDKALGLFSGNR